ncbi:MAG: CHASE2 domain-containing protein [Pseudomonadota bacterium]
MVKLIFKRLAVTCLALGWIAATLAIVDWSAKNSLLVWVEHWSGDWRTAFLADREPTQHKKVAIVAVTEETLAPYPYRLPPDRQLLARLITTLDGMGAKAIGIDFLMLRATEPEKDQQLVEAIRTAKTPIVLAVADSRSELLQQERDYQTIFLRKSGARPGYANLLRGDDRIVRYLAPPAADDGTFRRSFSGQLAAPKAEPLSEPRRIAWLLKPEDGSDTFVTLPAHLLAPPGLDGPAPAAAALAPLIKGRVIILGSSLPDVDRHATPLPDWEDEEHDGVFLQAQVVAQILDNRDIRRLPRELLLGVYGLLACLGMFFGLRYGTGAVTVYGSSALIAVAVIDTVLFATIRQFLPFQACVLAMVMGVTGGVIVHRFARLISA